MAFPSKSARLSVLLTVKTFLGE